MKWDEASVKHLISDKIEESQQLEYKRAKSLSRDTSSKIEITKDVSSMANGSGGTILYGIAEGNEKKDKHLPIKLDPIDRTKYSREWLEQIINNIRPRIEGIEIHPVHIEEGVNSVVYVVSIPKSFTAHQATDHKYHRRYNFEVLSMTDDEIRDVMSRNKYPRITIKLRFIRTQYSGETDSNREPNILEITALNTGNIYARYVNCFLNIPYHIVNDVHMATEKTVDCLTMREYARFSFKNTVQDLIDVRGNRDIYGPRRFVPLLPGLSRSWEVNLTSDFKMRKVDDFAVSWEVFADNSNVVEGSEHLNSIQIANAKQFPWM